MEKLTFDEVKMSHDGMLKAKEKLISRARVAISRQTLIGKAEFAVLIAALFLYEIWFALVVYAHMFTKIIFTGKNFIKFAVVALVVFVCAEIAAFVPKSNGDSGTATPDEKDGASDVLAQADEKAGEAEVTAEKEEAKESDTEDSEGAQEEEETEKAEETKGEMASDSKEDTADEADNSSAKENPDYYGWITSEDAGINSPIMQCNEFPEKYLYRDLAGKADINGLPSVVDEAIGDTSSIILYAGNYDGNGKFSGLLKYEDGVYQGKVKLVTGQESRDFEIVTGFAETESARDEFSRLGETAKVGDCILVLVTGRTDGSRFYVVAKSV